VTPEAALGRSEELFALREIMAVKAYHPNSSHTMHKFVLMAAAAVGRVDLKAVQFAVVTAVAADAFHEHMPCMTKGASESDGALRGLSVMAFHACFPCGVASVFLVHLFVALDIIAHQELVAFYDAHPVACLACEPIMVAFFP
jgi:hypothetical protein